MRVAVIGGGLQGLCIAFELASRGVHVDLYDKRESLMTQASAQNEGKIHLGYVYANDRSLATARRMIQGAVTFLPLLRRWTDNAVNAIPVSSTFHYVVHKASLLSVSQLAHHFSECTRLVVERGLKAENYFGQDPSMPCRKISSSELECNFDGKNVQAAFETPELSLDPLPLSAMLRTCAEANSSIRIHLRSRVAKVTLLERNLLIDVEHGPDRHSIRYDHVVNASWEDRLRLDRSAGLTLQSPWLWRLKYLVRTRRSPHGRALPSCTVVFGAFGDLVCFDQEVFLSWYPDGCVVSSSEVEFAAETIGATERQTLPLRMQTALACIVPGLADCSPQGEVFGGVIFARGAGSITDLSSGLHERSRIGVRTVGNYHSVDTGKLTTAPLFAVDVADRVLTR